MNFLLHVVVVLDPQNKMCYLVYCLWLIYGKDSLKIKNILEHVNKRLMELFENFKNKSQRERCEKTKDVSSSRQETGYFDGGDGVDLEDDFARFFET